MIKNRHRKVIERQIAMRSASSQSSQSQEQFRARSPRPKHPRRRAKCQSKQAIFNPEEKLEIVSDKVKQTAKINVQS